MLSPGTRMGTAFVFRVVIMRKAVMNDPTLVLLILGVAFIWALWPF